MGNAVVTSWRAKCYPESKEVTVDLSRFRAALPYQFHTLGGSFDFPFGLGQQTLQVGDFIDMARRDIPIMARVEVNVERKRKVLSEDELGRAAIDRLAVGQSQPLLKHDSAWRRIQKLDTDIGTILVECRVVSDVVGVLKLEMEPGSWISRGGARLVGRAEGSVEIYVRSRFETEEDRQRERFSIWALTTIIVVPVVLFRVLRYLAAPPKAGRLPPPPPPSGPQPSAPPYPSVPPPASGGYGTASRGQFLGRM